MADLDFSGLSPVQQQAPPSAPEQPPQQQQQPALDFSGLKPLDFSGLKPLAPPPKPPEDTGILAAPLAGVWRGAQEVAQTGAALAGEHPQPLPPENTVAAQPVEWHDLLNPKALAEKSLYQLGKSYPTLTGGVAGTVGGAAVAGLPGAVIGGGLGAGLATAVQALGPEFARALQENPKDPDAAFNSALGRSAASGAISGAGWAAFGWQPFAGTVKNMLFQAFGVQPGVAAAGQAAQNIVEGQPAGQGVAEQIPGAVAGTLVPLAGHAAGSYLAGRLLRAVPPPPPPAGGAAAAGAPSPGAPPPAGGMPPAGTSVNVRGIAEPLTVRGYRGDLVDLETADGTAHMMTQADFARLHTVIQPAAAPEQPLALPAPTEIYGPGRPWQSTGEGMIPGTPGFVMRPSEAAPPAQEPTSQPVTLEDIDRWAAEEHAAQQAGAAGTPAEHVTSPIEAAVEGATGEAKGMLPGQRPPDLTRAIKAKVAAEPEQAAVPTAPQEPGITVTAPPVEQAVEAQAAPFVEHRVGETASQPIGPGVPAQRMPPFERPAIPSEEPVIPAAPVPEPTPPEAPAALPARNEPAPEAGESTPPGPAFPPEPAPSPGGRAEEPAKAPVVTDERHTKTGNAIYAVRFPEKPGIEGLGSQARKLGGYWSSFRGGGMQPGWMFKTRDAADRFAEWARSQLSGVAPQEPVHGTSRPLQTEPAVVDESGTPANQSVGQLRNTADRLNASADESLSRERFDNTIRRARIAASAEGRARQDKLIASTMHNIADAIEGGQTENLSQVKTRADVETLDDLLRQAHYDWARHESVQSHRQFENLRVEPIAAEHIEGAPYPYPHEHRENLESIARHVSGTAGGKQIGRQLAGMADRAKARGAWAVSFDTPEYREIAERAIALLKNKGGAMGAREAAKFADTFKVFNRLQRMGITDASKLRDALREYLALRRSAPAAERARELNRTLIGVKIPGFFPTPSALVDRLVEEADIQPGDRILEPSAGKGDIVEGIAHSHPEAEVHANEINHTLGNLLAAKGVARLTRQDFMAMGKGGEGGFDKIVMNPPFENGQDIDHVQHAFDLLNPGGRIVAIMSEGPFGRSDRKSEEFRDWLDTVGGRSEKLPEGSFKSAFRPTGVATRMVVIDKPGEVTAQQAEANAAEPTEVAAPIEPPLPEVTTAARDLGPPGPPRKPRINPVAPSEAALEASLERAEQASLHPTLSPEQKAEAAVVRGEVEARFTDALTEVEQNPPADTPSAWRARAADEAARRFPNMPGKPPTASRRAERLGFLDAGVRQDRMGWADLGADMRKYYRNGEDAGKKWREENPPPDVGAIPVVIRTARGHETRLEVPRDPEAIKAVRDRYLKMRPELFYGLSEEAPRGWGSVDTSVPFEKPTREEFNKARPLHQGETIPHTQMLGDLAAHQQQTGLAPHEAVADWAAKRGESTGHEYYGAVTPTGGAIDAGTSGNHQVVRFSPDLIDRLQHPGHEPIDIHHNHPSAQSLSTPDLAVLAMPNARWITAHTSDGYVSAARLTPQAAAWLHEMPPGEAMKTIQWLSLSASEAADNMISRIAKLGMPRQKLDQFYRETVNRALDAAGVIDYMGTRPLPGWTRSPIERGAQDIADELPWKPTAGDISDRFHRSAGQVLRHDDAMARFSGPDVEAAAGRPAGPNGGAAGPEGNREAEEPRAAVAAAAGLAEEGPRDFSDRYTEAAINDAMGPPGAAPPGNWFSRLQDSLGARPGTPAGDHKDFAVTQKGWTLPSTKGSTDPMSNPKWLAELAKKRDATAFLNGYKEGLASWRGKPLDQWRRVFASLELHTLDGVAMPTDGRAIIIENRNHPFAALSKIGDIVRLDNPDDIRMAIDYHNAMDQVWQNLVTETARQFGWTVTPTSAAIEEAARTASTPTMASSLRRAAKVVAGIEYLHRTSYLPLMRHGDYFLRVTPKAGTPDRPGILGWDGDGFAPTVMFKLIDSRTPWERALGGMRAGTPKLAQAAIDELRKDFPDAAYHVSHGYMFSKADDLRDLDVPAVDKLMMLVGNDVRGQLADRLRTTGMSADDAKTAAQSDYDKLVDAVLDRIYEERVSGFKKPRTGVAGYDPDFARSTSDYLHWLSSYTSDLRHRPAIDQADALIANHPDPRTRAFWRDFDRRQEDYGDDLHGPLAHIRQGAFYWALGANAASTAKIMLHGPLLGVPTMTTGLDAFGHGRAAGDYLMAAQAVLRGMRIGPNGIEADITKAARTPEEHALLADSEAKGITHPQTADELAAIRGRGETALSPQQSFARRALEIWGSNISAADRLNRGALLLSSFRTANRVGMDAINRVWDRDLNWRNQPIKTPHTWAQFMVDRAAGMWGDINRVPWARSQLGGMVAQFRTYEMNYLSTMWQMMSRMGPEGKVTAALMLGGLGLLGGAVALPFFQDSEAAANWLYGRIMGIDPDIENSLKHAIDSLTGAGPDVMSGKVPGVGEDIMHGSRPFGIDFGTIGFGDLLQRNLESPVDIFGAGISMPTTAAYRAWERLRSGQGELAAVREIMPAAVKNLIGGMYPETGLASAPTGTLALAPSQISAADQTKMTLGFRPEALVLHYEQQAEEMHKADAFKQAVSLGENRIANLQARGADISEAITSLMQTVAQGEAAGVLPSREMGEVKAGLRARLMQRLHPEIPSKPMQRFIAAQGQAQP